MKPPSSSSSVQVAVRVRPFLASEAGSSPCIAVLRSASDKPTDVIRIGGTEGPAFAFDECFNGSTTQKAVFESIVAPLVSSCLEGYNATVLAYGQTGSGKTHTVMGPSTALQIGDNDGIIPRAIRSVFANLRKRKEETKGTSEPRNDTCNNSSISSSSSGISMNNSSSTDERGDSDDPFDYEVRIQFLELYGEVIRDLLTTNPRSQEKLTIRDVGMTEPEVLGAKQHKVESAEEALMCLTKGMLRRVTGETAMNASSSRSHAIMSVMIEQTNTLGSSEDDQRHHTEVRRSKFNFVDLAGSERQKRTKAEGQRLKEGIDINRGLLVLGNVISALGDPLKQGKTFVPYRDSKLTRLLKGSLGGNHKTLMIACVSPSSNNLEESLNCLRYANRAKNIQNNAVVNVDDASRLVAELKSQVQDLATELLRIQEGGNPQSEVFSVDTLKAMLKGEGPKGGGRGADTGATTVGGGAAAADTGVGVAHHAENAKHPSNPNSPSRHIVTPTGVTTSAASPSRNQSMLEIQAELYQTKERLRSAMEELRSTAEDVFTARAERDLYRLRQEGPRPPNEMEKAFMEKVAGYEKEIATLKSALQAAESDHQFSNQYMVKAYKDLEEERSRLDALRDQVQSLSPDTTDKELGTLETASLPLSKSIAASSSGQHQLDAEEEAEQAQADAATDKFLDEDDQCRLRENKSELEADQGSLEIKTQRIQANLAELSKSIEQKEGLIQQLQQSQEKYESMRSFYESKLREMEIQVQEREIEREALAQELSKQDVSDTRTKALQERLAEKDKHIAGLKKRQAELTKLTRLSSRNDAEISRLRRDVTSMKEKKVELQKLMTQDRKAHMKEIQQLKKEAIHRDREVSKWKQISDKKTREAERAQQVSRSHLDQISQLRTKYREAEKQLRVRTVKRSVMAKAGLDPVLVGSSSRKQRKAGAGKNPASEETLENRVDAVRDFLDQKVALVGRKDTLAAKLANEWEDHFELASQKEQIVSDAKSGENEGPEAIEAINVKLKFKQDRIRQLAKRLGKRENSWHQDEELKMEFMKREEFKGLSELEGVQLACRVMFGMVVRERRRVAALARTASSLDEKVMETEKANHDMSRALESYMEEERNERVQSAQTHQEQMLSLMAMVKQHDLEASQAGFVSAELPDNSTKSQIVMMATERIEDLEMSLRELAMDKKNEDDYKARHEETIAALSAAKKECNILKSMLHSLRGSLRQVRDSLSSQRFSPEYDEVIQGLLEIVVFTLRQVDEKAPVRKKNGLDQDFLGSSSSLKSLKIMNPAHLQVSESDGLGEVPEWAEEIMADLEVIASGEVPESLLDAPSFQQAEINSKARTSVFERLNNPENFTGVQKQKTTRTRRRPLNKVATEERRDALKKLSENLDKIERSVDENVAQQSVPPQTPQADNSRQKSDEQKDSRSVFERLMSPSAYTGTQKERLKISHAQGNSADADVLPEEVSTAPDEVSRKPSSSEVPNPGGLDPSPVPMSAKVSDYTQQDVFERLQRTTTQSYAVKHGTSGGRKFGSSATTSSISPAVAKSSVDTM